MGSFFYWLCFEMSLYVPLLIILSAYFFFRFPALLVAMYYKSYRMDDYWYVVMLGVAADICLLLYLRPWIYAAEEMIEAIVIIGMLLAVMQFIVDAMHQQVFCLLRTFILMPKIVKMR